MAENVILTSFAGGELSTSLYGRVDLDKYHVGAMLLRNFFVDYRGGVSYRPGTKYCASVASDADGQVRLIPFIVSRDQSYVLAFSNHLVEVFLTGVLVATVVTPYTGAEVFDLKYAQSADVMTITHPAHPIYNLNRTGAYAFNLALQTIGSSMAAPGLPTITTTVAGPLQYCYVVTALSRDGEESLSSPAQTVASKALDPTATAPVTVSLTWTDVTDARSYNIYKAGPVPTGEPLPTVFGYIGQTKVNSFTDNNIGPDFGQIPPEFRDPFSPGQLTDMTITSAGAGATPYDVLAVSGDGTGASAYAISKAGAVLDTVVITGGKNYTTATITPAAGSATFTAVINTDNHYPNCVAYFQQRRAFGGADISPTLIEMSKIGFYHNFDVSPAVLDSDAISINIASREVNLIQYMVPMSTGMVVFTRGSAFLLTGDNGGAITPANISATPQASTGAGNLPPLVINYNIVFNQYQGNVIRDMTFQWQTNSYYGADRSMLANHLFQGFHLLDWAWAEVPHKLLVCARNDGRAVVMTYVPEQDVYAWSHWDTQGLFRSFASVPEGNESAIYAIVRRHVDLGDGSPCWHNYLERFIYDPECCILEAWYLDAAVSLTARTPDSPLFITGDVGSVVIVTGYDPCLSDPGTGPFTPPGALPYLLEAKENLDATRVAQAEGGGFPTPTSVDTVLMGHSYDPVNRNIMYPAIIEPAGTTNTSGHTLWDGIFSFAPGDTIDPATDWNVFIAKKNIDTGVVTFYDTYDPTNLVPAGIGGGDGTWRRMVTDSFAHGNTYSLTDPRTGDYWVKLQSCRLYVFRAANSFKHTISPYIATRGALQNVMPIGMTNDWFIAFETRSAFDYQVVLLPRLLDADETAADVLQGRAYFNFPGSNNTGNYYTFATMGDKTFYSFSNTMGTGAPDFVLAQFVPPTSAPFGGPVVGGSYTDVTPVTWLNDQATGYTIGQGAAQDNTEASRYVLVKINNASNQMVAMAFMYKEEFGAGSSNFADSKIIYGWFNEGGAHGEGTLCTGLVDATFTSVAQADAKYALTGEMMLVNPYLDRHDFTFDESLTDRWFMMSAHPVSTGIIDTTTVKMVLVKIVFTNAAAPTVTAVYDDSLWGVNYPTYEATVGEPAVYASLDHTVQQNEDISQNGLDAGIYDTANAEFWFSGQTTNMYHLNENFAYREALGGDPPLLRIKLGTGTPAINPGDVLQIECGQIRIDTVDSGSTAHGTIIQPLTDAFVPGDVNLYIPLSSGEWSVVTPTATISGLAHLEGKIVYSLADGMIYGPLTVTGGLVTLPTAVTTAVTGLKYQGQMQTLRLDVGDPTVQGKRKVIPAVTIRTHCSAGMKVGTTNFHDMVEPKAEPGGYIPITGASPIQLFTGDIRANVFAGWQKGGVITIQQDQPLPCNILAVIPEVLFGDNQR